MPKKSHNNFCEKMIRNIYSKKKHVIDCIETLGNGDVRIWLTNGVWIGKKQFKNYEIYWEGFKNLGVFFK